MFLDCAQKSAAKYKIEPTGGQLGIDSSSSRPDTGSAISISCLWGAVKQRGKGFPLPCQIPHSGTSVETFARRMHTAAPRGKSIFRTNCVRCDRGAYKKEPAGLIDPAVTAPSSQRRLTNEQKVDPLWLQMNPLRIPVPYSVYTILGGLSICGACKIPFIFPQYHRGASLPSVFVLWMGIDTNWYQFVSVKVNLCHFASVPSFSACTAATVLRNLCDETRWASRYKQA